MTLRLKTPPQAEPVTVDEVKFDAGIDGNEHDAFIVLAIAGAREKAESETGRAVLTQTWELVLPLFPACRISIGKLPIQSVTSVKYYDANNELQMLDAAYFSLDKDLLPGWLNLNDGYSWPSTYTRHDAVIIEFVAGYGDDAGGVPKGLLAWIRLHAAKEADKGKQQVEITPFVASLLDPYRLHW